MQRRMSFILLLNMVLNIGTLTAAQDSLRVKNLEPHVYSFTIEDKKMIGDGAGFIDSQMSGVQFVLLGELHQSVQLGLFTEALLGQMKKYGFKHMAVETGPISAQKLMELSNDPEKAVENLNSLNRQYGSKLFHRFPIMFFHGIEDAQFLKRARELGYDVWGLDQEFYYSYKFLIDELMEKSITDPNKTRSLHKKMGRKIWWLYFKGLIFDPPTSCNLLNSQLSKDFFDSFDKTDSSAQSIISALKATWNIYCLNESGKYRENNNTRAQYMKTNFRLNYDNAMIAKDELPKVFIKLGSYHTSRLVSLIGVQDVGSMIYGMAEKNGTKSISFRHLRRHYFRDGKSKDYLADGVRWAKDYELFLTFGKKKEWTIINLIPLREQIESGELVSAKDIVYEIMNHDILIISPEDKKITYNH